MFGCCEDLRGFVEVKLLGRDDRDDTPRSLRLCDFATLRYIGGNAKVQRTKIAVCAGVEYILNESLQR